MCHKKAGDDACEHLKCIKCTGDCLIAAGVRLHHIPPEMVSTTCSIRITVLNNQSLYLLALVLHFVSLND